MSTSWDDEYDALMGAPGPIAGPSFIDRARDAPPDDDDDDLDRILGGTRAPVAGRAFRPVQQKQHEQDEETPLQQLIRHWMNERHAPDILPAQEGLLSGLLDHIRRQVCVCCA